MWPYWVLFMIPAFQAVAKIKMTTPLEGNAWANAWRGIFVFLVLMIGLRHEVGGDWHIYLMNMNAKESLTLMEAFWGSHGDPADSLINWVAAKSGLGVYLVNSVSAILFTWGLLVFCRNQSRPWLALTVAVPYLITVVAMGYTRQGVAIGLAMHGLVALGNKKTLKFLIWISLAATFHKSAVILVPLALLAESRQRLITIFGVAVTGAILFVLLLQEYIDQLVSGYIDAQYDSAGAFIRIAMNVIPACIFLFMRRRFQLPLEQRLFWTCMSWGALVFVVLLYISPSSTAVDRVALYWIPLQLFVWSRVPEAFGSLSATNAGWVYAVVAYSATVHFVWLFFAIHSSGWIPYRFYPVELLWH